MGEDAGPFFSSGKPFFYNQPKQTMNKPISHAIGIILRWINFCPKPRELMVKGKIMMLYH